MDNWIPIERDERHITRERAKARELRKSPYFQELLRKGICHYCGKKFPPGELTIDHIVPVVRGGRSTRGNMVVCCKACNMTKGCLTPAEQLLSRLAAEGGENPPENKTAPDPAADR